MSGFFAEYDVNLDDYEAGDGFALVPPGTYDHSIKTAEIRKSEEKGDSIVVVFALEGIDGEVYEHWEWYKIPQDPNHPTKGETTGMKRFKKLLIDAGFDPSALNEVGPEELADLTGTLDIVHNKGRGDNADKVYVNTRNIRFDTEEAAPAKPAPKKATKPAAEKPKAPAAAKPAGKVNPFASKK